MKFSNLSSNDWESLSAYLDGEMTSRERSQLEKELASNSDLQAALDDIRQTRAILRRAPHRRAPRSFALNPSLLRSRPPHRFYPYFRLVFAVTSILFVITFAGDMLGFGLPLSRKNFQSMQGVREVETIVVEKESEPLLSPGTEEVSALPVEAPEAAEETVEGEINSFAAAEAATSIPEENAAQQVMESPTEGMGGGGEVSQILEDIQNLKSADTAYPIEEAQPLMALKTDETQEGETLLSGSLDQKENVTENGSGQELAGNPSEKALEISERTEPIQGINLLQVIEISLLSIVVVSGLAMIYFRRR